MHTCMLVQAADAAPPGVGWNATAHRYVALTTDMASLMLPRLTCWGVRSMSVCMMSCRQHRRGVERSGAVERSR